VTFDRTKEPDFVYILRVNIIILRFGLFKMFLPRHLTVMAVSRQLRLNLFSLVKNTSQTGVIFFDGKECWTRWKTIENKKKKEYREKIEVEIDCIKTERGRERERERERGGGRRDGGGEKDRT